MTTLLNSEPGFALPLRGNDWMPACAGMTGLEFDHYEQVPASIATEIKKKLAG